MDKRKWRTTIESEVEEHHWVVRYCTPFLVSHTLVVPMGYETHADLLHPTCTTDASPVGRLFIFLDKNCCLYCPYLLYFNRPISDSRTSKVVVSKSQGTDLP